MRGCGWLGGWGSAIRTVKAKYVTCGEPMPKFHNAKVYSLEKLDSVAEHELFVTSDADVRVAKNYLVADGAEPEGSEAGAGELRVPGDGVWRGRGEFCGEAGCGGEECGDDQWGAGGGHAGRDEVCAGRDDGGASKKSFRDVGGFGELGQFYADDFEIGEPAGEAGDRGEDGDAHHQADGAGYAVLAIVSESAAVDAEYAAVTAVGASGEWVDVCHAVWIAGVGLGVC